ncbi:hypothetical protein EPIR_0506 [Erwinia piriflorinigrans CFBP 5888]|uniref:Uncharacterized protein n=1 Tax=Erwinia piriflorinigrans CFBP 5888 TaxID=1161919 RepID=V5Z4M0_9GAMM|nr:hypothetical protein EPIR_0506 [Erwinia piriflorinigrans CFBP 5888]
MAEEIFSRNGLTPLQKLIKNQLRHWLKGDNISPLTL